MILSVVEFDFFSFSYEQWKNKSGRTKHRKVYNINDATHNQ